MATTFTAAFRNMVLDSITGRATTSAAGSMAYYINCYYSSTQPADPLTAPSGSFVHSAYNTSPGLNTYMSQPSLGVSALNTSRSATAANALTANYARIYGSGGVALMDTTVSTSGGGGGVIVDNTTSIVGLPFTITSFSVKVPRNNGSTIYLSDSLVDAIASAVCVTPANVGACSTAQINIYSGTAPATADLAPTGTLLISFSTAATGASWNAASAGSTSLAASLVALAANTGTAGYARIIKGDYVIQGSVGTAATDFILSSTSIVQNSSYSLTNATITL